MKKIFFLIFLVILGCDLDKHEINKNTITIRITESSDNLELKKVRLLRLQSNSFALASRMDKVMFLENRIIVLDKLRENTIFIYDIEGEFINHIHRVGEGPGEYKNVENVFWNSFTNELVLIPMDYRKKLYFDWDGNFLREEFYEEQIEYADLVFLENGELVVNYSSMNAEDNFAIYQNGETKLTGFPYNPLLDDSPLNYRSVLSKIDEDDYLLTLGLRDTLYSVNIDQLFIVPKYKLDFGNELSFKDFNNLPNPLKYFMENDIYIGVMDLFQNETFISFSTLHSTGLQGRIYSKQTGKSYSTQELIENEVGHLGFEGILGITPQNEFAAVLSSGESGKWDFSLNPSLEKQFADFGQVDKEELILMLFDLDED
ncbi:6-bladed beta-propeller [Algoriphagus antarcticus]|uniref:6-bladed beta-propeller protein n=1 Tax=Algoriphagus antarcticus TaxID=238540 RepID=A0A3E0DQR6_9BACT|nr:6-bladed beta-propeller [Algoriphagus antarcticus]REG85465.1 6-bladed beta-propeller protein [Algoriphagus antarcticus]